MTQLYSGIDSAMTKAEVRMPKPVRLSTFVYLSGFLLLFLAACGPKIKPETVAKAPAQETIYEDENASPTVVIPKATAQNPAIYQPLPKKIINNSKTEIILEDIDLRNAKISYSSIDRQMTVTGQVILVNQNEGKITEKTFSLKGTHKDNQSIFILKETINPASGSDKKILVSAQAICLNTSTSAINKNIVDCNHVVVDIYILFNKKYYTQQIEINRIKTKLPVDKAPITPPAPAPAETPSSAVEAPFQDENEDQHYAQQTEDNDDSISGRYQGTVETVDLSLLFPEAEQSTVPANPEPTLAPAPTPTEPVKNNPAVSTPPSEPIKTPPVLTPPVKTPPSTSVIPKEQLLNPDIKQTQDGRVRPINQALGFPDDGLLRNATSLLTREQTLNKKAHFEIVAKERKRYFGTYEMADMISRLGGELNRHYTKTLFVSNISAQNGGKINPHVSHQNGLDADLAYPTDVVNLKFPLVVRMKTNEYFPDNFSVEKTYNILKFLFLQNDIQVDRIFIDQKIKKELCFYAITKNELNSENKELVRIMFENLQHVKGHGDHFHLRIKCSKADPACRGRIYKRMEACSPAS